MKFSCNRQKLNDTVLNIQRAVASKSTISALEGILIKAVNNCLILTGYDLEIGITTSIDAMIYEEGAIVLNARLFSDIIRRMPEENISIESDDKFVVYINSGRSDYKIIGIPAAEFPELPTVSAADSIIISGKTLKSMIQQTIYAVSDKDIKPAHKGSLFEIENPNESEYYENVSRVNLFDLHVIASGEENGYRKCRDPRWQPPHRL